MCVCVFVSVGVQGEREEKERESRRKQVVSDFHDWPVVDRRAILTH